MTRKKPGKTSGGLSTAGGFIGTGQATAEQAASDQFIDDMGIFGEAAERLLNVSDGIKQGNLFEFIETAKFNCEAARAGSNVRAHVTATEGRPQAAADIEIRNGAEVLERVQAKSSERAVNATGEFRDPKYSGMQKLTNPEHAERVEELSRQRAASGNIYAEEYSDTAENVTGELHHGEISSGGTSHAEAMRAAANRELYQIEKHTEQALREAGVTALNAAQANAVISGSVSLIKNSYMTWKAEQSIATAAGEVVQDTTKGAVKGAAIGGLSGGIRYGAEAAGLEALSQPVVATGVAAGALKSGVAVYSMIKGDITPSECILKIGQGGANTMTSIGMSSAALAVGAGPAIVLGAGFAGVMVSQTLYRSVKSVIEHAALTAAELEQARALLIVTKQRIASETARFQEDFERLYGRLESEFDAILPSLRGDDTVSVFNGLARLAMVTNRKLLFQSQTEFNAFMEDPETKLTF